MFAFLNIKNIVQIIIAICLAILIGSAVYFFQAWKIQKLENQRQTENLEQLRKYDSLKYASQTYSKKELEEYLEYSRQDLQAFLKENRIKTNRIEQIITQQQQYRDKELQSTNLQPLLYAIKNKQEINLPVKDSTKCLVIKGFIAYKNDTLSLNITDRKFTNVSDVISYWERKQWKFLGIKTRLFGKKTATVIIKNSCGETKTFVISKKN